MTSGLKTVEIWTAANVLRWTGELVLASLVCVAALCFCFPLAISQAGTHLWSHTGDPYALGDLGGAIYMVVRSSLGEVGCVATTHGAPWSYDICQQIPNPMVTNMLGVSVSRWGMPYGYNVGVLAFLVSNGVAVFLAARLFGAKVSWALVGAIVATAAPSIIYEVEGGYVQHVWWGPAVAGFALSVAAVRSWPHVPLILAGGLLLGFSVPVYAMIPFMLLPWAILAGLSELAVAQNRRGVFIRSGLVAVVASCFVLPQISAGLESAGPRLFDGLANSSTLMLGLEAFTVGDWFGMGFGGDDLVRSPGILIWSCLLLSALCWRRATRFAAPMLGGLIMLGISFGPSMDGGSGAAGFVEMLPYSLLMEHVELARGSMRPTRYGVAAVMLFSIGLPLVLTSYSDRFSSIRVRYHRLLATLFACLLLVQIRPSAVSPSLDWPPLPEVTSVDVEGIDVDEVWLDLPVVGRGENRFAQWAYNPVPRMNPPHDVGRWRDDVGQSDLYLLNSLMAIGRGEAPSEMWLRALDRGVPDVIANGLSRVIIHRQEGNPAAEVAWDQMLLRAGGERTVVNERVMVYQF